MYKKTLLLVLSFVACLVFSSSTTEVPPDPTLYSKKLFEVLKKNNQELYVSAFEITDADIDLLIKLSTENPYISKSDIERIQEKLSEKSSLKKKLKERLNRNYTKVQDWIEANDININTIEYLTFYYTIQLEKDSPFHTIKSGELFIKHGTKFYRIHLDDAIYINNQWKYGEIDGIEEVNEYLNYENSYEYAVEDSVYYDQDVAAEAYDVVTVPSEEYDYTTAVEVDTAYEYSPDYKVCSDKVNKKVLKLQKKINALYDKEDKMHEQ